jgi:cell division protein FtsW (lipid II flippase)
MSGNHFMLAVGSDSIPAHRAAETGHVVLMIILAIVALLALAAIPVAIAHLAHKFMALVICGAAASGLAALASWIFDSIRLAEIFGGVGFGLIVLAIIGSAIDT